eukprot:gene11965-25063_t
MPQYQAIGEEGEEPLAVQRPFFRRPYVIFSIIFVVIALSTGTLILSGFVIPINNKPTVKIWQTSQFHGDRHTLLDAAELTKRGFEVDALSFRSEKECVDQPCGQEDISRVHINSAHKYQTILGFGGAFTEASANNYFKLSEHIRAKVIDLYFGKNGIGYTLGRVHINSCDFSLDSYSFDDVNKDYDLNFFDMQVTHDQAEMIPFIKDAMKASKAPIHLLASPWSPPAWLKQPMSDGKKSMLGSAFPTGLRHEDKARKTWAKYISLFITAYKQQGVPIWAITPQNEPEFPAPWEACSYNTSSMHSFITEYLGPKLDDDHPEVLLFGFDHNKDHLFDWTQQLMANGGSDYLDGMAFHWYAGSNDRLMDGTFGYDGLNASHHFMPDKLLLGTEGCSCPGVRVGDWLRAERLGHDIIFDMNNWANGWIDWNLLLDSNGGPNHLKNVCDANILALPGFSDIYIQPTFYYMGHISKYVPPNSIRIHSKIIGNFRFANVDPGVRAGIELGLFHCELSTRQMWRLDEAYNNTLKLMKKSQDTEQTDILLVVLCAATGDGNRRFIHLIACEYDHQPTAIKIIKQENGQLYDTVTGLCIDIAEGILDAGALLELKTCEDTSKTQKWLFDDTSGEIKSTLNGFCLTAGWPFLTGAAFVDPLEQSVLVLMNEAPVDTTVVIDDSVQGKFISGINARSIQTVIYPNIPKKTTV